MKAVIMAGGEGTRLRPLTCGRPKPMVPVVNKPVMEHIAGLLKKHGFEETAVTLQYMPDLIMEYFGDGSRYGVKMRYFIEEKPLGTAGSVKNAEKFLDDTFLVISGDALTDIDLTKAVEFHRSRGAVATLVLKKVGIPLEYGVVVTDENGRIVRFLEKPGWGEVFSDTVNTGIYILSPEIFGYMKKNEKFDFSKDLFPVLLKEGRPMFGYITDDYWCDIGDISAYMQSHIDIMNGKVKAEIPGKEISEGIWAGDGTVIEHSARLNPPLILGSNCRIGEDSEIGSCSVIGDNSIISGQCSIERSILWKNCRIDGGVRLMGSILGNHTNMRHGASAYEQSVVGDNSTIGERAVIRPNIKLWPDKSIEDGIELRSDLIWGSKAGKRLFGHRGVAGEVNTDITPEFAARLAAAYGAATGGNGAVGISCDGSPASLMIKAAFLSGLLSAGIGVNDCGRLLTPAARWAVRFYRMDGGVHISLCTGETKRIVIDFFDKTGGSINRNMEKKIENLFIRDDFNRCAEKGLKRVNEVPGVNEFYLKNIINGVKSETLPFKILLRTSSVFASEAISGLLDELGCKVEQAGSGTEEETARFCGRVRSGGFDLGAGAEESCEKMMLVDEKGRLVTEDMYIALISLVLFRTINGGTVIVPVSASRAVEELAEKYGGSVVRTKTSSGDIAGKLLGRRAKEELLDQFTMHFDAIASLVKLLDFMSDNRLKLSELVDMLPEIHMHRQEVECGWESKGKVIRKLIQENGGGRIETLEGVKVFRDGGWVLVLPDGERPVCSVISESMSAEFAEELTNIYVRKIREISRS